MMMTQAAHGSLQDERTAPRRSCIVTRQVLPRGEMIRFVLGPDSQVVPDLKGTLPGRGAWLCAHRPVLAIAVAKGHFARAFKQPVKADAGLCDLVERLLEQAALGTLGLARKAGKAVAGFAKVEVALRCGQARVLIHASDAAQDGQRKLAGALNAAGRADEVPVIREFTSEQLSLALGGANVIHAAVLSGGMGEAFAEKVGRLRRFRNDGQEIASGGASSGPSADVGVV